MTEYLLDWRDDREASRDPLVSARLKDPRIDEVEPAELLVGAACIAATDMVMRSLATGCQLLFVLRSGSSKGCVGFAPRR